MGGHDSLIRQPLPTKLPKVEAWPIRLAAPEPRGVEDPLYEKFGYNDIDEVFQPTATYSRWVQPSQDELANQVEYDMNDADKIWLDRVNLERKKEGLDAISYEFFEIIMDKLEKEWFDLSKHFPKPASNLLVEDSKCTICDDGECEASNAIVFCDGCNLAVHQDCYGVPYIPEGQWLCRKCTVSPDRDVSCMLCPGQHGAFKQTVNGQWAHLLCAIWINETWVSNTVYMEPIDGIESIPKQRWRLICNLCKKRAGACIQCSKGSCYTAYHVTCARERGLYLKLGTNSGATTTDGSGGANISYCDKHSRQAFGEEEDEERAISEELREGRPKKRKLVSHGDIGRDASEDPDQVRRKSRMSASHGPNDSFASREASLAPVPSAKKKKKQRLKQEIPIIPRYIYDRVWNYIQRLRCTKKQAFVRMVCRYWSLKRSKRQGAPLLKRLHLEPWTASAATTRDATDLEREQRLELILQLRNDLEKVRNMVELVRKREIEKLRRAQLFKEVIDAVIFPQTGLFRAALREIQKHDGRHLFSKAVSKTDVPDYYIIVKHPMNWETMYEKLDQNAYVTAGDFQADVNLVIRNALVYNTPDSLHGKAAIKLRDGIAPLMAKLSEFDDPRSEIHQKHRRYLDAIDDDYIDNLMRIDYPALENLPVTYSNGEVSTAGNGLDNTLCTHAGTTTMPSFASSATQPVQNLGKRKRSDEDVDSSALFKAPLLFPHTFNFGNYQSVSSQAGPSQAGPSGTSSQTDKQTTKERKQAARAAELAKKRQQGAEYRARKRARKLAEKQQAEREAIIAAGGDPDAVAAAPSLPLEVLGNPVGPETIDARNAASISEPMASNDQAMLASTETADPPKVEEEDHGTPTVSPETDNTYSTATVVESATPALPSAEEQVFTEHSGPPRVNEWGAAIDRVEPPNDHEAILLFNEGWILPAGSKRRRASSANTEISGPVMKGRKASLPAPSVSPMLPTLQLPASAPSLSISLPPLAELSSSPDLPDNPPPQQSEEPVASTYSIPQALQLTSQPEEQSEQELQSPAGGASVPQASYRPEDESELSDIGESRIASPVASKVELAAQLPLDAVQQPDLNGMLAQPEHSEHPEKPPLADSDLSTKAELDIADVVPDEKPVAESELSELEETERAAPPPKKRGPGRPPKSLSKSKPMFVPRTSERASSTRIEASYAEESSDELGTEPELSDTEGSVQVVKTPKKPGRPRKSVTTSGTTSVPKSRSSSVKGRSSSKKPVSNAQSSKSKSPSKSSTGKRRGRPPKHRPEAENEGDAEDEAEHKQEETTPDEPVESTRLADDQLPKSPNGLAEDDEEVDTASPDATNPPRKQSPVKSRAKSAAESPAPVRTPARGRKKKGKRGRKPRSAASASTTKRNNKPSRTISQAKLKEVYSDKPTSFVLERLRQLLPHVQYNSFDEVEDYDLVWARTNKQAPYWPAEVCLDIEERDGDVPQAVLDADLNKHSNRQKLHEADESMSNIKRQERVFEHYVLVQWFPQATGNRSSWSWIPFDPEYMTRIGESKEYDAIMQNKYPAIVRKKKKGADDTKRIRAAYEDCFLNMETPPPSDSEEELQEFDDE